MIRKKNIMTTKESKHCAVCGDVALSFNFNGLCCESCKSFFRRNAQLSGKIQCRLEGKCRIDKRTRKYCKRCRLDKCFGIGMKMDIDQRKYITKSEIETKSSAQLNTRAHDLALLAEMQNFNFLADLKELHLVGEVHSLIEAVNFGAILVKQMVKFCKQFVAFKCLAPEDQLSLLKSSHPEMAAIFGAYLYDVTRDTVLVIHDVEHKTAGLLRMDNSSEQLRNPQLRVGFKNFAGPMQHAMDNDSMVRDLILVLLLFKPIENIKNLEFIRYNHFVYTHLLRRYFEHKYDRQSSKATEKFCLVMQILNQMTNIASIIRELHSSEIETNQLSQVLAEIYGLI